MSGMPPKKRSRNKKAKNAKNSEPDGKNSLAEESAPILQIEALPVDYHPPINGVTWDTLGGIPCFTCGNVKRCGVRQPVSPVTCLAINSWLAYESIPPKERQLSPPDFWAEKPDKRNVKLEGTKT